MKSNWIELRVWMFKYETFIHYCWDGLILQSIVLWKHEWTIYVHVYVYKNPIEGIVCGRVPLCFCFLHTGCKKAECGALLQSSIAPLVMFIGSLQRWSVSVEHTQQLIALPVYSTVKIINIFVGNRADCSRTTNGLSWSNDKRATYFGQVTRQDTRMRRQPPRTLDNGSLLYMVVDL